MPGNRRPRRGWPRHKPGWTRRCGCSSMSLLEGSRFRIPKKWAFIPLKRDPTGRRLRDLSRVAPHSTWSKTSCSAAAKSAATWASGWSPASARISSTSARRRARSAFKVLQGQHMCITPGSTERPARRPPSVAATAGRWRRTGARSSSTSRLRCERRNWNEVQAASHSMSPVSWQILSLSRAASKGRSDEPRTGAPGAPGAPKELRNSQTLDGAASKV